MTKHFQYTLGFLLSCALLTGCAENSDNSNHQTTPGTTPTTPGTTPTTPGTTPTTPGTTPDQPGTTPDQPGTTPDQPGTTPDQPEKPGPITTDPPAPPKPDDGSAIERVIDGRMVLPITYAPYTTLQIAHRPKIGTATMSAENVKTIIQNGELSVDETSRYDLFGLGQEDTSGEPWILKENLLNARDPDISHKGQSIAWFWQVSDPQIIDEESPCRMEGVTIAPYVVSSAYRAQGRYSTHMFDVHLQTAMRLSEMASRPFDFALVTGDIADNAQENENGWFLTMMGGGVLDPDTGIDDDPVQGPNNDASDPYYTQGIGDIPWYPAIGNHDMLYMGFTPVTEETQSACVGNTVVDLFKSIKFLGNHEVRDGYRVGFQDASKPDSPVTTSGTTPADPKRRQLTKIEALNKFYNAPGKPAGHGLNPDTINTGWGYYSTYPIPGKPLRLITLDTNSGSFSEANMKKDQFDWLKDQIEDAKSKNELVIVQSHHGTAQLSSPVSQKAFQKVLAAYPGVILHITGHGHKNDSHVYIDNGSGYWEVMLASVVDYPSQTRIFEIVHEGDGIISIYITNLDANAPKGSFVDDALNLAAAREFFGMSSDPVKSWDDEKQHRNLILRTKIPQEIYENLENYDWSDVIESETLLQNLKYNPK